ncbi:MAG: sugar ABC transporter permease [Nitrososphaerota archaeon]|nr:sugar ABC transporter permease [Nitrososphaerota archaeon]
MRLNKTLKVGLILALPIIVYFFIFFVYPIITLLQESFTNTGNVFSLVNFQRMLTDTVLRTSLINTGVYFAGSLALEYAAGFGVAILMYNYSGKLKALFRSIVFVPLMISPVVIGLMWVLILNTQYGPVDYLIRLLGLHAVNFLGSLSLAMPSIIVANGWEYSPFVFLIIYAGLQTVPQQLYEAASVDGLTRPQVFRYITLPSIRASMLVAFLLAAIGVLQGFTLVYVLTSGGPGYSTYILSFYAYEVGFVYFQTHYAAALSLLLLVIVAIFVSLMLKFTPVEEYLGLRRGKE